MCVRTSRLTSKVIANQIGGPARRVSLRCHQTRRRAGSAGATCQTAHPRRHVPAPHPRCDGRGRRPRGHGPITPACRAQGAIGKRVGGSLRRARARPEAADTGGRRGTTSAAEPANAEIQPPAKRVRCNASLARRPVRSARPRTASATGPRRRAARPPAFRASRAALATARARGRGTRDSQHRAHRSGPMTPGRMRLASSPDRTRGE